MAERAARVTATVAVPVTVYVCTTCRPAGDEAVPRLGARLLEALTEAVERQGLADAIQLSPVECLSVCKRPGTIAVTAPDKWTYVYADIDPAGDLAALVAGLGGYAASANGITAWRDRPEAMKRGAVARIPPHPGASTVPAPTLMAATKESPSS